jgi:hypothetical protein
MHVFFFFFYVEKFGYFGKQIIMPKFGKYNNICHFSKSSENISMKLKIYVSDHQHHHM